MSKTTPLQTELEWTLNDFYAEYYGALNRADNVKSPDEVFNKTLEAITALIQDREVQAYKQGYIASLTRVGK